MSASPPFVPGETVQLYRCGCASEAPYGTVEPPVQTRCLDCGKWLEKSRLFTLPPKPVGTTFFHWGERRWK